MDTPIHTQAHKHAQMIYHTQSHTIKDGDEGWRLLAGDLSYSLMTLGTEPWTTLVRSEISPRDANVCLA